MTELKCPICGKVFVPKRKDCRCCSTECTIKLYRQEHRKIHKKICATCGHEFEATDKRRKYCCELCAENARKEKSLACYHRLKTEYEPRICEQCGAEFQPRTKRSRFCSKKCASIHNQAMVLKKPIKPRKCVMCGKDFAPNSPSHKYCCEDCRKEAVRKRNYKYGAYCKTENKAPHQSLRDSFPSRGSLETSRQKGHAQGSQSGGGSSSEPLREGKKISLAAVRWAKMSLREISAECARYHLTYGQAALRAQNGTLPEDWGCKE